MFNDFLFKGDYKLSRVAKVVRRHEGPMPKSLDSGKNFKPQHTLYRRDIMICRDLRTFWKTLGQKVLIWVKNNVSWEKSALLHGTYCILY